MRKLQCQVSGLICLLVASDVLRMRVISALSQNLSFIKYSLRMANSGLDFRSRCQHTDNDESGIINLDRKQVLSSFILPLFMEGFSMLSPNLARAASVPSSDTKKTIVITGSNSGIGFNGASRMAKRGHRVILACRTYAKAEAAANGIRQMARTEGWNRYADLVPAECDLASLESIKNFADQLTKTSFKGAQLTGDIDVLCLNAGVARSIAAKDVARTKEGFELTVGTNHLGHFYLQQLLLPVINKDSGRIIVTASSVHDPKSPGGSQGSKATLGDLSGLKNGPIFDMVDGGSFDADKAYKDSKLCNVMLTRELNRRLATSGSRIVANCFSPGLIVGSGLFRDQNRVFTKIFDVAATNILKVGETVQWGGGALEFMALNKMVGSTGGMYYSSPPGTSKLGEDAYGLQFTVGSVSGEAIDEAKGKLLWTLSERVIEKAQRSDTRAEHVPPHQQTS